MHDFALAHENFLHDAGVCRLDDLQVALRNQLAFGHGDDVQPADQSPDDEGSEHAGEQPQHGSPERGGRGFLQAQQRWREVVVVGFVYGEGGKFHVDEPWWGRAIRAARRPPGGIMKPLSRQPLGTDLQPRKRRQHLR